MPEKKIEQVEFASLDPKEQAALQAAVIAKVIEGDIKPVREKANAKAEKVLYPGQSVAVEVSDSVIGLVTYKRAAVGPVIGDAFQAFVEESFPDEIQSDWVIKPGAVEQVVAYFKANGQHALIEERRTVRPEFTKRILADVIETDKGAVDSVTGEVIKGVSFEEKSKATIAVTTSSAAQKDAISLVRKGAGFRRVVVRLLGLGES